MVYVRKYPNPYLLYFSLMVVLFAGAFLIERKGPPLSTASSIAPPEVVVPDFASVPDVEERKRLFFDFLQPYVDAENQLVLAQREEVLSLRAKLREGVPLTRREKAYLSTISEQYEVEVEEAYSDTHFRQLLRRVDIIPSSLVLAQAANESAWGTSRFAIEGNNYFGQWCFSEGCGIVPKRRGAAASHEVRAFDSVANSVHSYFMNINTHPSYLKLRRLRQQMREQGKDIDSLTLTEGLGDYSERGEAYIEELQSMINYNELHKRDSVQG